MRSLLTSDRRARAGLAALGLTGLLVLLTWTLLTDAAHLDADFGIDTWLIDHQAIGLRAGHAPSLFLSSEVAAFYPIFAFYGGTLFALAGAIALVVGSAVVAQVIVYLLALAAAYGGWLWLGRMAGLRSWRAHAPAVLYVTAPYVLTNVYVRQDLAELVATAMIPPLLASALSVLRADRLHAGPAAALAASTVVFGGSHNLTLLWGATILGVVGLALAAAVPQARHLLTRRGVLRVLAIVVPAMAVNAWYLLPDLAYHADTVIAHRVGEWKQLLFRPGPVVDAKYLFTLGRPSAFRGSGLTCALPVLTITWVAVAAVSTRAQWRGTWARVLAILALATAAVLVLMRNPSLMKPLPDPWLLLQFSYRLESYALFGICGAVIAALVLLDRSARRWLAWLLAPIVAFSVVGAAGQIHGSPRAKDALRLHLDDVRAFAIGDYAGARLPRVPEAAGRERLRFRRADVQGTSIVSTLPAHPGDVVLTYLMTPARMIDVEGARVVGRWVASPSAKGWQPRPYLALRVSDTAAPGTARITVREARTLPIVGGRVLSLLGLLGLAANAAAIARARRRRRRRWA